MCGIFGYWDRASCALDDGALVEMAGALRHRGPDDEGIHHDRARGVAVGNRRLSIIDLAHGHQPFLSDDGRIALVQNGEIFNYVELAAELRAQGVVLRTQSDTEIILRLYEREGISCIAKLNGMFAIAIDDAREDALYLVRDRVGEKPLYVREEGDGRILFASEIKAFHTHGRPKRNVDFIALHHYLSFNYIPAPWTIEREVRHVMPGTWMRFSRTGVNTQRWWDLAEQREKHTSFEAWSEEFLALLEDSTRIRLRAEVPWGAFLSGGVDSSSVVALMARHVAQPIKTFCIGFDDPRFDESAWASEAARRFGCEHTSEVAALDMLGRWPEVLRILDQPHGDASFLPMLRVSELAAKQVKVVLTGDGGDELFAGYDKYATFFAREEVHALSSEPFRRAYFDSISLFSPNAKAELYTPFMATRVQGHDSFTDVAAPWFEQAAAFDRVNQALYLDMQLLLSGNNLVKPDRMGMAVSIEARAPFLDHRLMEFAFRTPAAAKLAYGDKKHWFKQAVSPLIGRDLAYRRKQMFTVPIGEWFKNSRFGWLQQLLRRSSLLAQVCRSPAIDAMLEAHRDGSANFTRELRALAALALWAEDVESMP